MNLESADVGSGHLWVPPSRTSAGKEPPEISSCQQKEYADHSCKVILELLYGLILGRTRHVPYDIFSIPSSPSLKKHSCGLLLRVNRRSLAWEESGSTAAAILMV